MASFISVKNMVKTFYLVTKGIEIEMMNHLFLKIHHVNTKLK